MQKSCFLRAIQCVVEGVISTDVVGLAERKFIERMLNEHQPLLSAPRTAVVDKAGCGEVGRKTVSINKTNET